MKDWAALVGDADGRPGPEWKTVQEISEELQIPYETIRGRLNRLRRKGTVETKEGQIQDYRGFNKKVLFFKIK